MVDFSVLCAISNRIFAPIPNTTKFICRRVPSHVVGLYFVDLVLPNYRIFCLPMANTFICWTRLADIIDKFFNTIPKNYIFLMHPYCSKFIPPRISYSTNHDFFFMDIYRNNPLVFSHIFIFRKSRKTLKKGVSIDYRHTLFLFSLKLSTEYISGQPLQKQYPEFQ